MGRNAAYTDSQLTSAVEKFYDEKGNWPTVANMRNREIIPGRKISASTDRLNKAIARAKSIRMSDIPYRYFSALAFLANFDSVEDALDTVRNIENTMTPSRLTKRELRALLALQDPYGPYPPFKTITKQQIRDALYRPAMREAYREIVKEAQQRGGVMEDVWERVEQRRWMPVEDREVLDGNLQSPRGNG